MSAGAVSLETRYLRLARPFPLDSGASFPELTVAYRTWGRLDAGGTNAVLVCHDLTGSADVDEWWSPLLGPGRALDPDRDFVVCANALGSCYGTTGPTSPRPDGRPWGAWFPEVSVRDMVRAQAVLLEALGARRLRLVVGGSLGGMQALEWPLLFPERVDAIAPIAAPARQSAWGIALSEAQRQAIAADLRWRGGDYPATDPPVDGLAAARMVALCAGGGRAGLERLFDRSTSRPGGRAVRGWLHDRGRSLAERFDARSYVALTRAADTHDVGRGRGGWRAALASVTTPALVVSIDGDGLHPPDELDELARALPAGHRATLRSVHGHEAFLIEAETTNALLAGFRAEAALPRRPAPERAVRGLELRYAV